MKIITYIFKKMFAPLLHDALSGRVLIYIQCHTILFESLFLFPFLFLFFVVVAYFRQTSAVSVTTSFGALNRPRDNLLLLVLFRRAAWLPRFSLSCQHSPKCQIHLKNVLSSLSSLTACRGVLLATSPRDSNNEDTS